MERTAFNNIFALQSGLYCHIHNDLLVINDREFIENRDLNTDLQSVSKMKIVHIILNAAITFAIIIMTYITGFYPLSLLLFVTIWDLKRVKRQTIPVIKSDCIPLKNIVNGKFISGKLNFNEIDLLIKNEEGKIMMKSLRLYDSKTEIEKAITILQIAGIKVENPLDVERTKLINKPFAIVNENEKIYFLEEEIAISKNGIYPEKGEYVNVNNFMFIATELGLSVMFVAKIYLMFAKGKFLWADFFVLIMLFIFITLPLSLFNKSTADIISKKDILNQSIEQKKKKIFLVLTLKSGWRMPLTRKIEFENEEEAKKVLEYIAG